MAQAKDRQKFKGRIVSVPSLSSDDANANTSIFTKDNDGSKYCRKCMHVKDQSKAVCCDY